jgi:hypothetical protein
MSLKTGSPSTAQNFRKVLNVAHVGFKVREGATGRGAVVSLKLMEMMIAIGMELNLSEDD